MSEYHFDRTEAVYIVAPGKAVWAINNAVLAIKDKTQDIVYGSMVVDVMYLGNRIKVTGDGVPTDFLDEDTKDAINRLSGTWKATTPSAAKGLLTSLEAKVDTPTVLALGDWIAEQGGDDNPLRVPHVWNLTHRSIAHGHPVWEVTCWGTYASKNAAMVALRDAAEDYEIDNRNDQDFLVQWFYGPVEARSFFEIVRAEVRGTHQA